MNLEQEIQALKDRNKKVETDKAWETSKTRRIFVAISTYTIALVFLIIIGAENAYLGACVPVIGFWLSTWSASFLRITWEKKSDSKQNRP